jgi:hypothetical protein
MLLKFLYNQFISAFIGCLVGTIVREYYESIKISPSKKKKKAFNAGILIVPMFSAILACGCTVYIKELRVEVYLLICVLLGVWGKTIIGFIMDRKFLYNFCTNIVKSIANPVVKGIVDSASKTLEEENKEKEKQLPDKESEKKEK